MSHLRFDYQRNCVRHALDELPGAALNVGCNEDAGQLRALFGRRVINCDLFEHDVVMDRPNRADVLFDCARDLWPFEDGSAAIVVLGDILEHLTVEEIAFALGEARRVSARLCVTVPRDERETNSPQVAAGFPRGAVHQTIVTDELLSEALKAAGWHVRQWQALGAAEWWADYFFVLAE